MRMLRFFKYIIGKSKNNKNESKNLNKKENEECVYVIDITYLIWKVIRDMFDFEKLNNTSEVLDTIKDKLGVLVNNVYYCCEDERILIITSDEQLAIETAKKLNKFVAKFDAKSIDYSLYRPFDVCDLIDKLLTVSWMFEDFIKEHNFKISVDFILSLINKHIKYRDYAYRIRDELIEYLEKKQRAENENDVEEESNKEEEKIENENNKFEDEGIENEYNEQFEEEEFKEFDEEIEENNEEDCVENNNEKIWVFDYKDGSIIEV